MSFCIAVYQRFFKLMFLCHHLDKSELPCVNLRLSLRSKRRLVEVAGVEPASRDLAVRNSTYLEHRYWVISERTMHKPFGNQAYKASTLGIDIAASKPLKSAFNRLSMAPSYQMSCMFYAASARFSSAFTF